MPQEGLQKERVKGLKSLPLRKTKDYEGEEYDEMTYNAAKEQLHQGNAPVGVTDARYLAHQYQLSGKTPGELSRLSDRTGNFGKDVNLPLEGSVYDRKKKVKGLK